MGISPVIIVNNFQIDIAPAPPYPMAGFGGCTVTLQDSDLDVRCSSACSNVTNYLVLLYSEGEVYVSRSSDVLSPILFEVIGTGPYQVIVFPIMGNEGILGTSILYSEVLGIDNPDNAGIDNPDNAGIGKPSQSPDGNALILQIIITTLIFTLFDSGAALGCQSWNKANISIILTIIIVLTICMQ